MESAAPDGISEAHARPSKQTHSTRLVAVLLLGGLVMLALLGLLGGKPSPTSTVRAPGGSLSVSKPAIIRNGEFFETRIRVTARAPIRDAVIAVSPALWRDLTVNTFIPAASEEAFKDGLFRFSYGPLEAGEQLELKIDSQINPSLFGSNRGEVALLDGDRPLARVPLTMTVLP